MTNLLKSNDFSCHLVQSVYSMPQENFQHVLKKSSGIPTIIDGPSSYIKCVYTKEKIYHTILTLYYIL